MFDAQGFLNDNFNDPGKIVAFFGVYGVSGPVYDTVRKWFSRGKIPSEWLPVLLALIELENGEPVRVAKYLKADNTDGKV